MDKIEDYSVQHIVEALKATLISYLEMQYHIKDTSLIKERRRLLDQEGTVFQRPFIESTPIYEQGTPYDKIDIPQPVKEILTQLTEFNVGIYPKPYRHQTEALKAFLTDKHDLIVATGTGSGKTESFLMPILGSLVLESLQRPKSAKKYGCRALLLYPLNALVNDQLSRLRRLFGNEKVAELLAQNRGRQVRFGAYNSRTPYPGPRSSTRDGQHIKPLFEDYYLNDEFVAKKDALEELGRWPSKDLEGFYALNKIEKAARRNKYHWDKRLKTQPNDRELLTRHEMQATCPDLLITNYSMLEYMLMRPVEHNLFKQTKEWLAADKRNEFILVLDEAHMYRGTGGAEVALLIRRLQARLGIPRERMRCILTSASLGDTEDAKVAVKEFAADLTGLTSKTQRQFQLITGVREKRHGGKVATMAEAQALADFDLKQFYDYSINNEAAIDSVMALAKSLKWSTKKPTNIHQYLYDNLTGFGPAETLIKQVSGNAVEFTKLAQQLFPKLPTETQTQATSTLLALCTFARDKRVLAPMRLHLFYRGLPSLYACINPNCNQRLDNSEEKYLLGCLYTAPRTHCDCGGRVYELLTHQDCGSAFIRAYIQGTQGDFLLHLPSGNVGQESVPPLDEIHILVEKTIHPNAPHTPIWLDIKTGRIARKQPDKTNDFLKAYVPTTLPELVNGKPQITFSDCPVCTLNLERFRYKLSNLETKGEGTFANLVKAQVINQPPQKVESQKSPNAGRKSLLFSDGRQKAARLALYIPREVELDSFRQAICLAAQRLTKLGKEPRPTRELYVAFVAVALEFNLQFFDRDDQRDLRQHILTFRDDYEADLGDALGEPWDVTPPAKYQEALLRQLCHPYYSLQSTTIAYVEPSKRAQKLLYREIVNAERANITIAWLNDLLRDYAFDKNISKSLRQKAASYPRGQWGNTGNFRKILKQILLNHCGLDDKEVIKLEDILRSKLCVQKENNFYFLDPNKLRLVVDLERAWYQCQTCAFISPVTVANHCPQCGGGNVEELSPDAQYIKTRKRFWRDPVANALAQQTHPRHITAEEHTAQLSHKDVGKLYATTEKRELQFQDILLDKGEGAVDVLSCTTTMEVGVDIGALTAVGLRNVPPQRENYQQRAGRSGRRGAAVSTVITYAQGGHHDGYYFHHPDKIIAGDPRKPVVNVNNEKIAKRHIHAFLFQTFFHTAINQGKIKATQSSNLYSALGNTQDFFNSQKDNPVNLLAFETWVRQNVIQSTGNLREQILEWLPDIKVPNRSQWLQKISETLLYTLNAVTLKESDAEELLNFLFDNGFLPMYAFPTDLCSFPIEEWTKTGIAIKEQPQQSIAKALSEYAPGRIVIVDKRSYRVGGVTSAAVTSTDIDKAAPLFKAKKLSKYVHCTQCSYVQDTFEDENTPTLPKCPVCHSSLKESEMLIPEVFRPEKGKEIQEYDRDQEWTYASSAQFPLPVEEDFDWKSIGKHGRFTQTSDRRLVIVNKGKELGTEEGFEICEKCGAAAPINTQLVLDAKHKRPYFLSKKMTEREYCNGQLHQVLLGTVFRSDLLLIRISIESPFRTNMQSSVTRQVLEDALRTLSEALLLAASRTLDIDPTEFSAGFRIVPTGQDKAIDADVYLFDTLTGGAGYADQAGQQLDEILKETLDLLEHCPNKECTHSCQDCLRHYANQYWHEQLDRYLAADLLRYMLTGTIPSIKAVSEQSQQLQALKRLLELDGYECHQDDKTPLLIKSNAHQVGTYPGLLDKKADNFQHPLQRTKDMYLVNDYFLDRNLPGAYQELKNSSNNPLNSI
ncbi:MAG: DEAD/DEAH box helicase [Pseudomonadota bacterium]